MRVVEATYPGLLQTNQELLFKLKCRQFVEMIGGYDRGDPVSLAPRLSCHSELSMSNPGSPNQPLPNSTTATPTNQSHDHQLLQGTEFEMNGSESDVDGAVAMEIDGPLLPGETGGVDLDHNPMDIERVLSFGRELQSLFSRVTGAKQDDKLKAMLQVETSGCGYGRGYNSIDLLFNRTPSACWRTRSPSPVQWATSLTQPRGSLSAQL